MNLNIESKIMVTNDTSKTGGTSSKSEYVTATYNQMSLALGKEAECYGGGDKVSTEWVVEAMGMVVTIYDWKLDFVPHEKRDTKVEWHLGGNSKELAQSLARKLNEQIK